MTLSPNITLTGWRPPKIRSDLGNKSIYLYICLCIYLSSYQYYQFLGENRFILSNKKASLPSLSKYLKIYYSSTFLTIFISIHLHYLIIMKRAIISNNFRSKECYTDSYEKEGVQRWTCYEQTCPRQNIYINLGFLVKSLIFNIVHNISSTTIKKIRIVKTTPL